MDEISILKKNLIKEIKARKEAENTLKEKELEINILKEKLLKLELEENSSHNNSRSFNNEKSIPENLRSVLSEIIQGDLVPAILEDENRTIILVNQRYCDLFKIDCTPKEVIGNNYAAYQDKEKHLISDPESYIHKTQNLLNTKKSSLIEELQFLNGEFYKRKFLPLYKNNTYSGILWVFENITEAVEKNKKIEALSRISEESPNPIIRLSKSGELMYNNAASIPLISKLFINIDKKIFYPRIEIFDKELDEINSNSDSIKKEIKIDNEFYQLIISPIPDKAYINIYATNITDQKNAEEKIQILKELVNQSPDPIFINDEAGNYIFVNNSYAQKFNLAPSDFNKLNISDESYKFSNSSWEKEIEVVKKKGKLLTEEELKNPDDTSSFYELSIKFTRINSKGYVISLARDISERYMASNKLQKQKEFYETILANIPTGVAVFNTNFEYLYLNQSAITNKELREWIIGKTDFDYCKLKNKDISLAEKRLEFYSKSMKIKEKVEWEEKFQREDGEYIYELRKIKPVLHDSSEVELLVGYGLNITEQKKIQEKLEKSEELYRLIIEATNDGIWDWNIETGHLYLSPQWKKMMGYKDHELENHISTRYKLMHPDDKAIEAEVLKNHLNFKKPYNHKLRYFHKDGSLRYIKCRGFVIRNKEGKATRMIGSVLDLTESQLAEEQLRANEEKLNSIFNNSVNAIFLVNYDSLLIIDCNQRAIEIFEVDKKEDLINIKGSTLHRDPVDPTTSNTLRTELITKGEITKEFEYKTKKGKEIVGLYRGKVMYANSQKYILVSITDITEKKRIEQELIIAKQIAEDSTKAKELFLANMSHEIRTPLNGILGFMDLLSKTNLTLEQQSFVKIISSSADNLLRIINDILDIAKIESGKLSLEKIPFNILEIINNAITSLSYKAEEKSLQILNSCDLNIHSNVLGDPYRLTQIILNLLNNAIKFTERGQITITCKQMREMKNEIIFHFAIADTGIGIAEDKLESIFEGFTQANSDTSRKYGGTGLGLTICKNLIQMQGGKIWVESKLNKGSIFHFTISYTKGNNFTKSDTTKLSINLSTQGQLKVLLAEDHEINQLLAKRILTDWGFEIEIANNGEEAVKLFEEKEFDIILMDIQMPFMSGLEATNIIRNHPNKNKSNIPIIALTANALVGDAEKYLAAGMNEYLSKPFKKEDLYEIISRFLPLKIKVHAEAKSLEQYNSIYNEGDMDLEYLNRSLDYDQTIIQQIIQKFIETTPGNIKILKTQIHEKNYQGIYESSHKLKATIDSFGIKELQTVIRDLENLSANKGPLEKIQALADHTCFILNKLISSINKKTNT